MEGEKKDMEGEKRDMEGKWGKENKHPAQTKIKKLTTAACNTFAIGCRKKHQQPKVRHW